MSTLENEQNTRMIHILKESYHQLGCEIADLLYARECSYALSNPKFLPQIQAENNFISEQLDLLIVTKRNDTLKRIQPLLVNKEEATV